MIRQRLLRISVCILLVICLIINVFSFPIRAIAVVDDITLGIVALLLLAAAGVVVAPQVSSDISALGRSFSTSMYQWGTSAEKLDEVEEWFGGLTLYNPGSDGGNEDDDDWVSPSERKIQLARGILGGICTWIATGVVTGYFEAEGEAAPDGYTYYNDILLPTFPYSTYPYTVILHDGADFRCYNTEAPLVVKNTDRLYASSSSKFVYGMFYSNEVSWRPSSTGSHYSGQYVAPFVDGILWSNYDIYSGNDVIFQGSAASGSVMDTVVPSVLVGPLSGVSDPSTITDDDIVLPDSLNYGSFIQDGVSLEDSVMNTMDQLAQGSMTHEAFWEDLTAQENTGSDVGSGTDVWNPPDDPGAFALDLTQYFPFCIPFDIYAFFSCLNADPVTPVIHWELPIPGGTSLPVDLDLSPFDDIALLLRRLELLLFCVGLAFKTRDLIKG